MFSSFISVVSLISPDEIILKNYLINVQRVLNHNFSNFEIILINNKAPIDYVGVIQNLDESIRKDITVLNLSNQIDPHNALVAGLDRSNGDYTVVFDMDFSKIPHLIVELYKKTQENFDIVYFKYKNRKIPFYKRIFYKFAYFIINKYSNIKIDINMHNNGIISRRALNSILQIRDKQRFMKAIYSSVGYNTHFLEVDIPSNAALGKLSEQFKSAIKVIISFTDILNRLLIGILVTSILFCGGVAINALLVKFLHIDIFGTPQQEVPGWAFLVIMILILFIFLFFILYIFSLYLISIYSEIKTRPIYFIESIQRF